MIKEFLAGKTANFYGLERQLSNAAVEDLFREDLASQPSASQNLFYDRPVRGQPVGQHCCFFMIGRRRSSPRKLVSASAFADLCSWWNIGMHIAVFKSRLDFPAGFTTRYLGRVTAERVDVAIARNEAIFEKSDFAICRCRSTRPRNRTFEADDLRNVVGPAGSQPLRAGEKLTRSAQVRITYTDYAEHRADRSTVGPRRLSYGNRLRQKRDQCIGRCCRRTRSFHTHFRTRD